MNRNIWQGDLVRLRAIEPEDWQHLHRWDDDSFSSRLGWRIQPPGSAESSREWARNQSKRPEDDNYRLAIASVEGSLVGSMNVHSADRRNGTFEYGITLGLEYQRRGYGSDAIKVLLRYFFEELGYQKCNAVVFAFNQPSQRMHESLGFQREGLLRRNVYTNGAHHDVAWYGITREEFREKHPGFRFPFESGA